MPPILYEPSPYAVYCEGESLTEPEHKDSCDINKMIKAAHRGIDLRGNPHPGEYGYDDTTMDGLTFRIEKEKIERELAESLNEAEFTDEHEKLLPDEVKRRYKIRKKAPVATASEAKGVSPQSKDHDPARPTPPAGHIPPQPVS